MRDFIRISATAVICLAAGVFLHRCQAPPSAVPSHGGCAADTVRVHDTVSRLLPRPRTEIAMGTGRYTLPRYYFIGAGADTLRPAGPVGTSYDYGGVDSGEPRCGVDSVTVELPMIQRHYADSTYEAWVSGPADPRLDSVRVFSATTIVTREVWKPPKRWHIGVTAGCGLTPHGFEPYIGVGVTYSILSF